MAEQRILVVDDEASVREVVGLYLRREGYAVSEASDGAAALSALQATPAPDLLILDVMLPEVDGLSLLRQVRQAGEMPVILLTARSEELDRVLGLELGADDYVTKPFSPRELVSRVRAVLRRAQPAPVAGSAPSAPGELRHAGLALNAVTHTVTLHGQPVILTAREFDLLNHFMQHPQQVFSRTQLLDAIWGVTEYLDPTTVTVHIRRLREKIERDPGQPRYLHTVWGVGYKFDPSSPNEEQGA